MRRIVFLLATVLLSLQAMACAAWRPATQPELARLENEERLRVTLSTGGTVIARVRADSIFAEGRWAEFHIPAGDVARVEVSRPSAPRTGAFVGALIGTVGFTAAALSIDRCDVTCLSWQYVLIFGVFVAPTSALGWLIGAVIG